MTDGNLNPEVSVIIVNLNGEGFLGSCLDSVLSQGVKLEIVVVDNGSNDDSVRLLRANYPSVKVIENTSNLGFAAGVNQGADLVTGRLLLLLNNDARLGPQCLIRMVETLDAEPRIAACQPTLRRPDGSLDSAGSQFTRTGFLHHVSEAELKSGNLDNHRFSLKGACLLVRAELFQMAGRLDDSYFAYFEETDLCWRLIALGFELKYLSDVLVMHDVGRTTTKYFPSEHIDYLSFRNRISTIRKNGTLSLKLQILPVHFALCVAIAIGFTLKGKFRNAGGILLALLWHLRPYRYLSISDQADSRKSSVASLRNVMVPLKLTSALDMYRTYLVRW